MNGLKISFAVVAFVLIQGVAVIWYVSKLDSRVDQMYKSFEEENKKDKEIVKQNKSIEKQHRDLFQMLQGSNDMIQQNQTKGGSYSYGD